MLMWLLLKVLLHIGLRQQLLLQVLLHLVPLLLHCWSGLLRPLSAAAFITRSCCSFYTW